MHLSLFNKSRYNFFCAYDVSVCVLYVFLKFLICIYFQYQIIKSIFSKCKIFLTFQYILYYIKPRIFEGHDLSGASVSTVQHQLLQSELSHLTQTNLA